LSRFSACGYAINPPRCVVEFAPFASSDFRIALSKHPRTGRPLYCSPACSRFKVHVGGSVTALPKKLASTPVTDLPLFLRPCHRCRLRPCRSAQRKEKVLTHDMEAHQLRSLSMSTLDLHLYASTPTSTLPWATATKRDNRNLNLGWLLGYRRTSPASSVC